MAGECGFISETVIVVASIPAGKDVEGIGEPLWQRAALRRVHEEKLWSPSFPRRLDVDPPPPPPPPPLPHPRGREKGRVAGIARESAVSVRA